MTEGIALIRKYFPSLTPRQEEQLQLLADGLRYWNRQINVISRKDIDHLWEHHLLHSLAPARVHPFPEGTAVADIGTGGGLPGLPLAILLPACRFTLVDSTGKKIRVVDELVHLTGLTNVTTCWSRAETMQGSFDIITGRGVTRLDRFYTLTRHLLAPHGEILYLSGTDQAAAITLPGKELTVTPLTNIFKEPYFEGKAILRLKN